MSYPTAIRILVKSSGSPPGREIDEERKGDDVPAPCVERAALRRHFVSHLLDVHEGNHVHDLDGSCKSPSWRTLGEEMRVHVLYRFCIRRGIMTPLPASASSILRVQSVGSEWRDPTHFLRVSGSRWISCTNQGGARVRRNREAEPQSWSCRPSTTP